MNFGNIERKRCYIIVLLILLLIISNLLTVAKLYIYNRTLKEIKEDLSQTFLSEINRSLTITNQFIVDVQNSSEFNMTTIGYLSVLQKSIGRMFSLLKIADNCFESKNGRDFSFFNCCIFYFQVMKIKFINFKYCY